jgi:tetratricopeptide (TPR) repeat protein
VRPAEGREGQQQRRPASAGRRSWDSAGAGRRSWDGAPARPARTRGADRSGERPGATRSRAARSGAADQAPLRGSRAPGADRGVAPYRPRESGPRVPEAITAQQLDPEARAQLHSLPNDLADTVARYLVAAGTADDPERSYEYAQAARRLAARVGVVREASGIAAYQTGRWAEALSELRAARRLTGRDDYLPVMADSERALGRLDRALALIREADGSTLDRATQIELRIVESGIRRDQGLADAAVVALQVPELTSGRLRPWSARLFYAYADALLAAGRTEEAREAFARAVAADADGETDAADRLDELDGVEFEDLEESEEYPEDVTADPR